MLLELLSQSNYQSYNVKLAHILGLEQAIYFNALLEINEKACRKNKVYEGEFFKVDRDYITSRTTISVEKQVNIEKSLATAELLSYNFTGDFVKVNTDTLITLLKGNNENLQRDMSSISKAANSKSKSKGDYVLDAVKRNINSTFSYEVRKAYGDWLDAVYSRMKFTNKQMLFDAQNLVSKFTSDDKVALEIIGIAAANGWKDMTYAIDRYKQRHPSITPVVQNNNVAVNMEKVY